MAEDVRMPMPVRTLCEARIALKERKFPMALQAIEKLSKEKLDEELMLEFQIVQALYADHTKENSSEHWSAVIMLAEVLGDTVTMGHGFINLAVFYLGCSDLVRAEMYLNRCLEFGKKDPTKERLNVFFASQRVRARLWQLRGQPRTSLSFLAGIMDSVLGVINPWEAVALTRVAMDVCLDLGELETLAHWMDLMQVGKDLPGFYFFNYRLQWQRTGNKPSEEIDLTKVDGVFYPKALAFKHLREGKDPKEILPLFVAGGQYRDAQIEFWLLHLISPESSGVVLPPELKSYDSSDILWDLKSGIIKHGKTELKLKAQSNAGKILQCLLKNGQASKHELIESLAKSPNEFLAAENIFFVTMSKLRKQLPGFIILLGSQYSLAKPIKLISA